MTNKERCLKVLTKLLIVAGVKTLPDSWKSIFPLDLLACTGTSISNDILSGISIIISSAFIRQPVFFDNSSAILFSVEIRKSRFSRARCDFLEESNGSENTCL